MENPSEQLGNTVYYPQILYGNKMYPSKLMFVKDFFCRPISLGMAALVPSSLVKERVDIYHSIACAYSIHNLSRFQCDLVKLFWETCKTEFMRWTSQLWYLTVEKAPLKKTKCMFMYKQRTEVQSGNLSLRSNSSVIVVWFTLCHKPVLNNKHWRRKNAEFIVDSTLFSVT